MWGAIIGDLAGSIYEYKQYKKISTIKINKIIEDNSFFSDDTILTVAILDAILNDKNYKYYLKKYSKEYYGKKPSDIEYFKTMFSPNYMKWVNSNEIGNSKGNGSMMRISPVGYLFNNEEEIKENACLATICSHNTKEAIEGATLVSLIIYYARLGLTKEEIINKLDLNIKYIPFTKFNTTCGETIGNCLYATFINNSYENAISEVISYGADTDTNAAIVGSMAEALYGIDDSLIIKAKSKLPDEFVSKIEEGYSKVKRLK